MTHSSYHRPVPNLDDPEMGAFWRAARAHRLTAQRCVSCGDLRFPALPICPTCLDLETEWVDVSQTGTIWSYVVYHRAFQPGFDAELPYAVAIVENDDGVRYTGMIAGDRERIAVGARVRAHLSEETDEFTLVQWELDDADV
jgi:uncharacterized OB-fold protein